MFLCYPRAFCVQSCRSEGAKLRGQMFKIYTATEQSKNLDNAFFLIASVGAAS